MYKLYIFQFYLLVVSTYYVVVKKIAKKVASKIYKEGGSVPRSREQLKKDKPILNSRQIRLAALKKAKRQERLAKRKAAKNVGIGIKPLSVGDMVSNQYLGKAIGPGLAGTPKQTMKVLRSHRKLKEKVEKQNRIFGKHERVFWDGPLTHPLEVNYRTRADNAPWMQSISNKASLTKWDKSRPALGGGIPTAPTAQLRVTPYIKQKGPTELPPIRNSFINRMNRQFSDEELRSAGYGHLIKRKNKKGWKG